METVWLERLSDPNLVFGLAVRFFGVFAVLIIVMIGIWLMGHLMRRIESSKDGRALPSSPKKLQRDSALETSRAVSPPTGPEEPVHVPDEVVAAIAIHVRRAAETGALVATASPVPEEVAAAISLALSACGEMREQPLQGTGHHGEVSSPREVEGAWKILARQEATSRNHPWAGRWGTGRGKEPKL